MKLAQQDMRGRLAYILHLGLVEIRKLAAPENHQQVFDLADALEILPRHMNNPQEQDLELIRFVLRNYLEKYPGSTFDYLKYLEGDEAPEAF